MIARALPLVVAVAVAAMPVAAEERLAGPVPAEVLRVIDGDTLVVRAHIWLGHTVETHVRLAGIDAPELRGQCAAERAAAKRARALVAAQAGDGRVTLSDIRFGKFAGRVVSRVAGVDGTDFGETLIAAGLGRAYTGGPRGSWCNS